MCLDDPYQTFPLHRLVACLFATSLLVASLVAAESANAEDTFAALPDCQQIVDVLGLPGGNHIYLHKNEGPCLFNAPLKKWQPIHKHPGRYTKQFERIYADPQNPTQYFTLAHLKADKSYGLAVYRYKAGQVIETRTGRMRDAEFYQNKRGIVFAWSRHEPEIRWFSSVTSGKVDVEGFDDGWLHRFAIWQDNQWQLLPIGMNSRLYSPTQILSDRQDQTWITACDGSLHHCTAANQITQHDWRDGITTQAISYAKIIDDTIWLFDRTPRRETTQRHSLQRLRTQEAKLADSDSEIDRLGACCPNATSTRLQRHELGDT